MLTLLPVMVCAYAVFATIAAQALRWRHPARHLARSPQGTWPTVTVIVAARNEQADLPRCIAALEALDYPKNLLEVLLVDDESTDNTKSIITQAAARHAHFRALSTAGFISPLRVKARPLDCAARQAKGEWLLITDADGAVRPGWVRQLMAAAQSDTGILCGSVIAQPQRTVASRIESLVTAYLMGMSFGLEALGAEPVCTGPNMAIRRSVYVASGGLEAANFFVAEDAALWRLSHKQGMRSRGVGGGEALVTVIPTPSFAALVSQHRRWLGGGFHDGPRLLKLIVAAVTAYAWLGSVYTIAGVFAPTWLVGHRHYPAGAGGLHPHRCGAGALSGPYSTRVVYFVGTVSYRRLCPVAGGAADCADLGVARQWLRRALAAVRRPRSTRAGAFTGRGIVGCLNHPRVNLCGKP